MAARKGVKTPGTSPTHCSQPPPFSPWVPATRLPLGPCGSTSVASPVTMMALCSGSGCSGASETQVNPTSPGSLLTASVHQYLGTLPQGLTVLHLSQHRPCPWSSPSDGASMALCLASHQQTLQKASGDRTKPSLHISGNLFLFLRAGCTKSHFPSSDGNGYCQQVGESTL